MDTYPTIRKGRVQTNLALDVESRTSLEAYARLLSPEHPDLSRAVAHALEVARRRDDSDYAIVRKEREMVDCIWELRKLGETDFRIFLVLKGKCNLPINIEEAYKPK